jgi:hypothetical protein
VAKAFLFELLGVVVGSEEQALNMRRRILIILFFI